jgi:enamine deaminase RidA (YjgF/YER057c/UK114 family)
VANSTDIAQLKANPQALQQFNKQLEAVEEDSKEVVENETLEAVKTKIFVNVIKKLKDERSNIVRMMQQAGLPASEINDVDGLPSKYEREIFEIARLGGVSGQI